MEAGVMQRRKLIVNITLRKRLITRGARRLTTVGAKLQHKSGRVIWVDAYLSRPYRVEVSVLGATKTRLFRKRTLHSLELVFQEWATCTSTFGATFIWIMHIMNLCIQIVQLGPVFFSYAMLPPPFLSLFPLSHNAIASCTPRSQLRG